MEKEKIKVGGYTHFIKEIGKDETTLPIKEGEIFYTVKLEEFGYLDVLTQTEAEIISRLVRIEKKLSSRNPATGIEFKGRGRIGETYKTEVTVLFYSTKADKKEAMKEIRELCMRLKDDAFEGVIEAKTME